MPNPTASALSFCGRASELETLKASWRLASNVEDPSPQVVVIKAERGLGKTRLALEFYKWLRDNAVGWLTKSYWPDATEIIDRNLEVNPEPDQCKFEVPIPHLWWGLKVADRQGDAVGTYDRYLAPHLAALLLKSQMAHHGWSMATTLLHAGLDAAAFATANPGLGALSALVSVGKGTFHIADILHGVINKRSLDESKEHSLSRADAVLADLRREFRPGTLLQPNLTYAKVPGVLFIDDAQFLDRDAALPTFVERLMYNALVERWPLLILVTHWRKELAGSDGPFARILKHAREGLPTDLSPAYCLPGGYMTDDHFTEIDLEPIPDLSEALREKLPGLTDQQSAAILADMGGNPRFLEQVIAFLLEHEGLFEDLDTSRSLTAEGLEKTLGETRHQDIFKVVLRRLRDAPEEVQEAICLAGMQGMRFANDIVNQLAQDVLGHGVSEQLGKGEHPYSMLKGTKANEQAVGEFTERLFHQVAQERRESLRKLKSFGGERALQAALGEKVKKVVRESDPATADVPEALAVVCQIAVNLFEHSGMSEERAVAQKAASTVAYLELMNGSLESSAAWNERLLTIKSIEPGDGAITIKDYRQQNWERITTLENLAFLYRLLDWPVKQARTLTRLFTEAADFPPGDLYQTFLGATDQGRAAGAFSNWKQNYPDVPVWVYEETVKKIVTALLRLYELARAWPALKTRQGDQLLEELGGAPLLVRAEELDAELPLSQRLPNDLDTIVLESLAYAQDGVLGKGEVAKLHFWLLERDGRTAMNRRRLDEAEDCMNRAMKINEELIGDEMFQLSTLNNLAAAFGQGGDVERATKYLELTAPIVSSYMQQPTFPVDLILENSGPDGRAVIVERRRVDPQKEHGSSDRASNGSQWIRRAHVPVKLSKEFDANPDEVLSKDRTMMGVIARVFGNAGQRALAKDEAPKARKNFLGALAIHEEIGDPEGAFYDLERLTHIAYRMGEREEACAHLRRCLALAPALQQVDPRRWKNVEHDTRNAMHEAGCTDKDATAASTDPEPRQAPSSDHPL